MLLSEALAARKDALREVEGLGERLAASVVRFEDQDAPTEDPSELSRLLDGALDQVESLTVRINLTNNRTTFAFDGRQLSIMEAVVLRDRLLLEAQAQRAAVDAIEDGLEIKTAKAKPYASRQRRSKDDVRRLPTVDYREQRSRADALSQRLRRLDLAMQQLNWTTELVD